MYSAVGYVAIGRVPGDYMPTYSYSARDRGGRSVAGTLFAGSEDELRKNLRANDLFLTDHKEAATQSAGGGLFGGKVTLQDRVIALRQLATFFKAGVPLNQGLEVIAEQTTKPMLLQTWMDLRDGVNAGDSLSGGMRRYPKIFPPLVMSLVEAGETAGTLDETLEVAAIQLDREDAMRRRVKAAMFYPKMVVAASIGTVVMMLLLVVPVFADVYKTLKADLPPATTALIVLSNIVCKYWWMGIVLGIGLAQGFKRWRETENGGATWDRWSLKFPVVGILLRKIAIARSMETLAGALKGGVPIMKSLQISADTAGNTVIRDAIRVTMDRVQYGAQIGDELKKSGQFPLMVTKMIEAGEQTGDIDSMLMEINRYYERDVEYEVDKLTRMIEPLMTILVGCIVLFVLLALYMPVFNLGKAFQKSG